MRKEGLDNLTLTGHIKNKRDREKQRIVYQTNLCKYLVEQGLGSYSENTKAAKRYKGQETVVNHNHPHNLNGFDT